MGSTKFTLEHHRFMELKHFCMQYKEWKDILDSIDGYPRMKISGGEKSKNVSDPTVRTVERREEYVNKIEMVEQAAKMADERLAVYLIKAVTEGVSYYGLRVNYKMSACKQAYYEAYRRFFFVLDILRK